MDKLKKSEIEPNLACIRQTLGLPDTVELIPFFGTERHGTRRAAWVYYARRINEIGERCAAPFFYIAKPDILC